MRVVFPYFAQLHQVFHSLPIAAEMARRHPEVEVHVAMVTQAHQDFIRRVLAEHAPDAPLHIDALSPPWPNAIAVKQRTMIKHRQYFRSFDAVVVPERTSLFMRQLGLGNTQLIWTRHGAGDRAVGFARNVDRFDFVLLAGQKIEQRLLAAGLIRPGHYVSGIYAKFDWLRHQRAKPPLFDNGRQTVLYNPHFQSSLSSWTRYGLEVLDFFAASAQYNLIFAPHMRLFDPPNERKYRAFERYRSLPHLHIDLGSVSSIDMSYVDAADLYLGDVSSQVSEFVIRPRPCLFIDAHGTNWRNNPNYRFWKLGPVIDHLDGFALNLAQAFSRHADYSQVQQEYIEETFGEPQGESSAMRGADAIVSYLGEIRSSAVRPLPSIDGLGLSFVDATPPLVHSDQATMKVSALRIGQG